MGLDILRYHAIPVEERCVNGLEHNLNNLGYLRSSYNERGFNNVCRAHNVPDLYDIFSAAVGYQITGDHYYHEVVRENIPKALELARQTNWELSKDETLDMQYKEEITIVMCMLYEMQRSGYGLLLGWSA